MKIISRESLNEVKDMKNGEKGLFEYVDCGRVFQDVFMAYDGEMYFKMDSCIQDVTGAELECFGRYDENNNHIIAVVNLDGSIELN